MTRSNLDIKLSNGKSVICVADSSSAPEHGYIVEQLLLPLLSLNDSNKEMALLSEHCTMNERRVNATYRYIIDIPKKQVRMYEEHYNYRSDTFRKGKEITERYTDYLKTINKK